METSRGSTSNKITLATAVILGVTVAFVYLHFKENNNPPLPDWAPAPISAEAQLLMDAIQEGELSQAGKLVRRFPELIEYIYPEYGTPVHLAAAVDDAEMVEMLLEMGARLEPGGRWGGSPLHLAAWAGSHHAVKTLLARGANPNSRCEMFSATPLLWAAHGSGEAPGAGSNYIRIAEMLLAAGASADTHNSSGQSALSMASPELAEFLRRNGASDDRDSPARSNARRPIVSQKESIESVGWR